MNKLEEFKYQKSKKQVPVFFENIKGRGQVRKKEQEKRLVDVGQLGFVSEQASTARNAKPSSSGLGISSEGSHDKLNQTKELVVMMKATLSGDDLKKFLEQLRYLKD